MAERLVQGSLRRPSSVFIATGVNDASPARSATLYSPNITSPSLPSSSVLPRPCDRSSSGRHHVRTIEWQFFQDAGEWPSKTSQKSKYRNAKCLKCTVSTRSHRSTMRNHILKCSFISSASRAQYLESGLTVSPGEKSSITTVKDANRITNHFVPAIKKSQLLVIENHALRFALSANISLNALANAEFLRLVKMLNPSVSLPGRTALGTTVLNRLLNQERLKVKNCYGAGAYVALSIDDWLTPTDLKWLRFCRLVRLHSFGEVIIDVSRFQDVTESGETEAVVISELENEMEAISDELRNSQRSKLVAVIFDSCNVGAKKKLAEKLPNVCFLACYAHQLNLMAGNVLMHESAKHVIARAKTIVLFFNTFPKQRSSLQKFMIQEFSQEIELVTQGETRWYSHYGLIVSLFRSRRALELYKDSISDSDPLLMKEKAASAIDTIRSSSFWSKLGLIAEILRPLTIEIGMLEGKGANLSDVLQVFGRIWALLKSKHIQDAQRFQHLPGFLGDLLERLEWRLNIYYEVDVLVLSHALDPHVRFSGLLSSTISRRYVHDALLLHASKYCPDLMANGENGQDSQLQLRGEFCKWIQLEGSILCLEEADASPYNLWRNSLDFDAGSILRQVAERLLSMPASAADLERVWSATLLTFSTRRRRLTKGKILKSIQIKADISMQHQAESFKKAKADARIQEKKALLGDSLRSSTESASDQIPESSPDATVAEVMAPSATQEDNIDESDCDPDRYEEGSEDQLEQALSGLDAVLQEENMKSFVDEFLDSESTKIQPLPGLSVDETDAMLDGTGPATLEPARKKRRLPGFKRVKRTLESLFDFHLYKQRAESAYAIDLNVESS